MKDLSNKNVIRINKNGVQYLQFRKLLEYKDIITHAYSIGTDVNFRTARVNKQQLPENEFNKAIQDYKNLCNAINVDYKNIVKTNQEHTDNIAIANKKINQDFPDINLEEYSKTDGIVTNRPNLVLSTTNADCILLLFFDPVTKTIANTHSGWKGTLQRISIKTVEKMINEFNSKPEDIICCICPSIRKCHFEVNRDVKEMFENEFKDLNINKNIDIMEKQKDKEKWNIDTVLINRIILKKAGLKDENIIDSGLCSVCNKDLIHSFRVEKQGYGLNTALISLIEK
ncbi:MAG: peptidoglycan editing factor PgeF [Clostridia bacterium]